MEMVLSISNCSFIFISIIFLHISAGSSITSPTSSVLGRLDFPPGFVFGASTSAYQVEGAAAEDGRKPSIWDTYTHDGKTPDKGTGDVAADQYHKYKDDVKLMHKMGLDAYRFSISWSRLIPDGRGAVNLKGLNYYSNLIDELLSYGIEAHVTLSHFDLPQALQDEYEGFLSSKFIEDFTAYADVCFKEYGDRVKSWITFNEPNMQTVFGYDIGGLPPGRCTHPFGLYGFNCSKGDSTTEPYLATHNILLSHASAVQLYRTKYQDKQEGQIGITLVAFWLEPATSSPQDIAATQRARDFHLGWYLDPLVYGIYPAIMRKIVGSRLPNFTEIDSKQLKGSFDFIGLNYYIGVYILDFPRTSDNYGSDYLRDISAKISFPSGALLKDFARLKGDGGIITAWGLQRLLEYVKLKYKNPAAVIYENGFPMTADDSANPASRNDTGRIKYLQRALKSLYSSVRNGSNTRGYFVWSFLDCFEAIGGYTTHFGLYGVDFSDKHMRRYPRQSVHWYSTFLAKTGRKIETSSYLYSE
ncbi:hypothetical protein IFM89_036192 [Coptis chinensis]|uniref:Uncharacterized protein n=1 Tax=Coptis chinensis TaxID=261450 RepID=A0A835IS06_9MAGN|nr:hypothetical protein IFM89_036192 [Coptis chinensis]